MSDVIDVQKGTDAIGSIQVLEYPNGPMIAPDSSPTVLYVHVNGVINDALTVTISQRQNNVPANIVGYYQISFPTADLAVNDDVEVAVRATIQGYTTPPLIKRFRIAISEQRLPTIR